MLELPLSVVAMSMPEWFAGMVLAAEQTCRRRDLDMVEMYSGQETLNPKP